MEEYALVVEYMPTGPSSASRKEAVVQLVGTRFFTLLEATLKPDAIVIIGQKVYVGKENRVEIDRIKGRIQYNSLTTSAKDILSKILRKIVEESESHFIEFVNKAKPISIRVHTLDLLPGIGRKSMESLLDEREKKPFESFQDLRTRVPSITDPLSLFANRIIHELRGEEKHFLFTKPFAEHI